MRFWIIWGLRLTKGILNAARAHWGLGDAPITLIAARENQVFRVETIDGPTALRLHRPGYRQANELRSELQWMAMLAQNGIPVPHPFAALDGSQILVHGDTVVDLLSWLKGAPLNSNDASKDVYFRLGKLVAQMHILADDWILPTGFARPAWDLAGDHPSWGQFWNNPQLSASERDLLVRFRDIARVKLAALSQPDVGLIHADLVPDNVLRDGDQLQPIDFDDGGFGYRLFDLATITYHSRRLDQTGGLARATLEGYSTVRLLDFAALPLFEALRACTYVGWNITRLNEDGGDVRNTRFIAAALANAAAVLTE
ncbi:MAG: Ser/Thr protein kinase RdoA (MazF antagonist) [Ascidiaceihabitans sp.]|jgi:Ser/Thr protein kinase RdoA (MazF antagonist)